MAEHPEKLDLRSHGIAEDKKKELLQIFPEIRTENGRIDFDRLKLMLGKMVDAGKERYGMIWPGKADCYKIIQTPSLGTLLPCPEESINFNITENLILEGDNLEVLKLLQKPYLGKVKMIYLDPPYNTGNDFIYPDNYTESLQTYLEYTGQVDSEGKKFSTNTEADGRFHSKWIKMMYPRLYLARNLLSDEGLIFISIDDNAGHHLRLIANEIFGEENYLATMYIQVRYEGKTLVEDSDFQKLIEQVLVYRKSEEGKLNKLQVQYSFDKFEWEIVEKGTPREIELGGKNVYIFEPGEYKIRRVKSSSTGLKEIWASGKVLDGNSSGRFFRDYLQGRVEKDGLNILYKVEDIGDDGLGYRYFTGPKRSNATKGKYYQGVPKNRLDNNNTLRDLPIPCFFDFADSFGNCRHEGNVDFRNGKKPIAFIKKLVEFGTNSSKKQIILDFFAGSGTTAHAVIDLNKEDGGKRKFILVQLPEPMEQSEFRNIAELTKERVRRVIKKITVSDEGQLPAKNRESYDLGFRVFKLAQSNFKPWNAEMPHDAKLLKDQLFMHIDHIRDGRNSDDILYELLIKSGFPLTTPIEKLTLTGKTVHSMSDGAMLICLERKLNLELIRAIAEKKPERVVCLDEGFAINDQLKANAAQIFKTKGITSFKTV